MILEHVAGEIISTGPLLPAGQTEAAEPEVFLQLGPSVIPVLLTEGAAVAVRHLLSRLQTDHAPLSLVELPPGCALIGSDHDVIMP